MDKSTTQIIVASGGAQILSFYYLDDKKCRKGTGNGSSRCWLGNGIMARDEDKLVVLTFKLGLLGSL